MRHGMGYGIGIFTHGLQFTIQLLNYSDLCNFIVKIFNSIPIFIKFL